MARKISFEADISQVEKQMQKLESEISKREEKITAITEKQEQRRTQIAENEEKKRESARVNAEATKEANEWKRQANRAKQTAKGLKGDGKEAEMQKAAEYAENAKLANKVAVDARKEFTTADRQNEKLNADTKSDDKKLEQERSEVDKLVKKWKELNKERNSKKTAAAFAGLKDKIVSTGKAMLGLNKSNNKSNLSFKKGFSTVLKYGFGIRSLYMLFRKLKAAVKEAITNIAKVDAPTRQALVGIKSAMAELKGNWGAAFAPIIQVVAPMLVKLINLLSQAGTAVAKFFMALKGGGTIKKAVANTAKIEDSLKGAASGAGDAKKQLAGFDELNVLSDNSGSGDDYTFADEEVGSEMTALADSIKALADEGKWREIGAIIAQRLNDLVESIDWNGLGTKLGGYLGAALGIAVGFIFNLDWQGYGAKIAVLLNGLLSQINGEDIGQLLMSRIFAVTNLVAGFLQSFDWAGLVLMAVDAVKGAILNVDWAGTISGFVDGIISVFSGIADGLNSMSWMDWIQFAIAIKDKIWETLSSIDWAGLFVSIVKLIISAVATSLKIWVAFLVAIWDGLKQAWTSFKEQYLDPATEEMGGSIIKGIFVGIWNAMKDVVTWIWEKVCKPIIEAFCEAFGIHSPSTVAAEWGKMIIEGLCSGITDTIAKVRTAIDRVKQTVVEKFTNMKNSLSTIVDKIKGLFNFNFSLPKLKLPHLQVTWTPAGSLGKFFGISSIPHLSVQWYAKGGIVDGATLIGAGEKGKEAIVPLENNTEWIDLVANKLVESLTTTTMLNRLSEAFSNIPMPAVASGLIAPPMASSESASVDVVSKLNDLANAIMALAGQPVEVTSKTYLDRREIGSAVTQYQREMARAYGR